MKEGTERGNMTFLMSRKIYKKDDSTKKIVEKRKKEKIRSFP